MLPWVCAPAALAPLLDTHNAAAAPLRHFVVNITEPIDRAALFRPDHPAIVQANNVVIPYAQLLRLVDSAAYRLVKSGMRPRDVAALDIAGPDEAVGIIIALALARIGVASAAPSIADADCHHRFGSRDLPLDASWLRDPGRTAPPFAAYQDGGAILRVFASSGTTGLPKHIPVSHEQYRVRMEGYGFALSPAAATRIIATGFGITWGFSALMRTLWGGGTIVLSNPARFAAAAAAHRVSCLTCSPVSLAAILSALPIGIHLPKLDTIEVSGAALPAVLAAAAQRLCRRIDVMVGASETGAVAAATLGTPGTTLPGAAGILLPFIEARTVDEDGHVLPPGDEGALQYRGPGIALCYLDSPFPLDAEGWFSTTDYGAIHSGSLLCLLGRTTDVINCGGVKTLPAPIEAVIARFAGIADCAVFPVPGVDGLDQIWAAVTSPAPVDLAALAAATAELGPLRPVAFLQPAVLPRNANGKVLRGQLRQLALARLGRSG